MKMQASRLSTQLLLLTWLLSVALCSCARLGAGRSSAQTINAEVEVDRHSKGEHDRILSIPGLRGPLPSRHYSGYIPVSASKRLFYYFVESERSPENDPVVLWLNGGPGCSSFDGFVYEMGPFNFKEASKPEFNSPAVELVDNPFAWNKVANMIYLDSPAGVGLSYSTEDADYLTGDAQTAEDAQIFLRLFFQRHPSFQSNRFYVSGESYAGIYVPNLAQAVVSGNDEGQEPHINIEGYLVGNGCTDEQVDADAFPLFAAGKSLISQDHYSDLQAACGGSYWNRSGTECERLYFQMTEALAPLNMYDVLEDCYSGPNPDDAEATRTKHLEAARLHAGHWPTPGAASRVGRTLNYAHFGLTPPCTDSRLAAAWLNHDAVRRALHAVPVDPSDADGAGGAWQLCSERIIYNREVRSTIPIHHSLTGQHGLRALIYSGDHDLAVPHTGSERWTREMQLPVRRSWGPWYDGNSQVGGYFVEYEGLTYATCKGAGHMVPETRARAALSMFERFIHRGTLASVRGTRDPQ